MKRWSAFGAALLLVGFAAFSTSHPLSADDGWVTLFDGKSLDNFNQIGTANWRIEDGVAVADKGNGFLVTKNAYTDYQLRAEFWVDADANSGIFIRATDPAKISSKSPFSPMRKAASMASCSSGMIEMALSGTPAARSACA